MSLSNPFKVRFAGDLLPQSFPEVRELPRRDISPSVPDLQICCHRAQLSLFFGLPSHPDALCVSDSACARVHTACNRYCRYLPDDEGFHSAVSREERFER